MCPPIITRADGRLRLRFHLTVPSGCAGSGQHQLVVVSGGLKQHWLVNPTGSISLAPLGSMQLAQLPLIQTIRQVTPSGLVQVKGISAVAVALPASASTNRRTAAIHGPVP